MSQEEEQIRMMAGLMPRSSQQLNQLFEADAEIVEFNGQKFLVTMDEFSDEDQWRTDDPERLGWNLAVGAISDILATGGVPTFYAHSLTVSLDWDDQYLKLLASGVACALKEAGVGFLGGDFGRASVWRCTAMVLGILSGRPLLRSGARAGELLFLSGEVGRGNLEAFLRMAGEHDLVRQLVKPFKNQFSLRLKEAELIREYATACIDTSDGVFNALNTLSELSQVGYEVSELPYLKTGRYLARLNKLPKTLLFLGEGGEYELLFTIKLEDQVEFFAAAWQSNLKFHLLGRTNSSLSRILFENGRKIDLTQFKLRARDFTDQRTYLKVLIEMLQNMRGN